MFNWLLQLSKHFFSATQERVINKETPKGMALLSIVGAGFYALKSNDINLFLEVLKGMPFNAIPYQETWVLFLNGILMFGLFKGVMLIFKRAEKWVNEAPIKSSKDNDKNNMSFSRYL
jgi:hypothetical protein